MPYTFRINFLGLCAFVPSTPIDECPYPTEVDSVVVLVPDLRLPRHLSDTLMISHYPSLAYLRRQRRRRASDRDEELIVPRNGHTPQSGLCFLNGEDLVVEASSKETGKLRLLNGHDGGDDIQAVPGENDHSVFWLAKLEHAVKGAGVLQPGLVPPSQPPDDVLLARLVLDRGSLSAGELVTKVVTFDQGSSYRQQIVKMMTWQLDCVTGPVEIVFRPFDNAPETKLVLRPRPGERVVEVTLRNLELEAFLKGDQYPQRRRGSDFEIYYPLSTYTGNKTPAPVFPPEPQASIHELCPPGLFDSIAVDARASARETGQE